jgi:hypothetical protein
MAARTGFDELPGHPHPVARLAHAAVQYVTDAKLPSDLLKALQHSGRVIAVFSGHVHRAAGQIGSIAATVVPCIATTLRRGDYPPHIKIRPVYQVHRFDPVWGFTTETRIVGERPAVS